MRLFPGLRKGLMRVPVSKSHAHRVLIAEFLAGRTASLAPSADDCDDIAATKRCLNEIEKWKSKRAEKSSSGLCALDCGESGTTRRLLGPVVAALGLKTTWIMKGRLATRPQIDYETLRPGVQTLAGDISSQFVSGLLFALPILDGDSEIRLSSPLASRGYVEMTLQVLRDYGVRIEETATGFRVPGHQVFSTARAVPSFECDWSGAAFPLAMKEFGCDVEIDRASLSRLSDDSRQPDRVVVSRLAALAQALDITMDMDACPDLFPVLAVVAAHRAWTTRFVGIRRLRLKESDRVAAMAETLNGFGITVSVADDVFEVYGRTTPLQGGAFTSFHDHRIAMALAVGATVADAPVEIDDVACAAKSYPTFFSDFASLDMM